MHIAVDAPVRYTKVIWSAQPTLHCRDGGSGGPPHGSWAPCVPDDVHALFV